MPRRRPLQILLVAAVTCSSGAAVAQSSREGFALDRYRAPASMEDGLAVERPDTLGHLRLSAAAVLEHAHAPLVLRQEGGDEAGDIVSGQAVLHLVAALGIGDRVQVSLALPLTVLQTGDAPGIPGESFEEPDSFVLADPAIGGSALLAGDPDEGFQLALSVSLPLPLGSSDGWGGDGGLGLRGRAIAAYEGRRVTLLGSVGAAYRPERDFDTVRVGPELLFDAGVHVPVVDRLVAMGELYGATGLRSDQAFTNRGTPLEALVGARWASSSGVAVGGGVGVGLSEAPGVPDVRVLLTAGYATPVAERAVAPPPPPPPPPSPPPPPPPPPPVDTDGDGLVDDEDECPSEPEDRDEFEDEDGCPDPDDDHDGVLDPADRCPREPESRNGVEDEDGCPDTVRVEGSQIRVLRPVEFETDRDVLRPRSIPILEEVNTVLDANPQIRRVRIEGHTDSRGAAAHNLDLSGRRANAVMRWLVEHGIAAERLEAQGFGETRPIADDRTPEGRQTNRRVELHIVDGAARESP